MAHSYFSLNFMHKVFNGKEHDNIRLKNKVNFVSLRQLKKKLFKLLVKNRGFSLNFLNFFLSQVWGDQT